MRFWILPALTLALVAPLYGSWGSGGCFAASAPVGAFAIEWKPSTTRAGWASVWQGRTQLGAFDPETQTYYTLWDDGSFSKTDPPTDIPVKFRKADQPPVEKKADKPALQSWQTNGVTPAPSGAKPGSRERTSVSGREIAGFEARDQLTDDSKLGSILVVSADAGRRKKAIDAVKSAGLTSKYTVQAYDPNDQSGKWILPCYKLDQDPRYVKSGLCVLALGPRNEKGKAQPLGAVFTEDASAIRNIDPNYKPDTVPDPSAPASPLDPNSPIVPAAALVTMAGAGYYLLKKKR